MRAAAAASLICAQALREQAAEDPARRRLASQTLDDTDCAAERQAAAPTPKPPLTVGEALRNIAAEALERRRVRGLSAKYHADLAGAGPVLNPFDEAEQHWTQVRV